MPVVRAALTTDVLDPDAHRAAVAGPRVGAVVSFEGTIRNHDPESAGEVAGIEYTHHPDAARILAETVRRVVAEADPGDQASVAVSHRVGELVVGDVALVCCVATAHRAEAFALCAAIVDAIKADVPVWKRQRETSGRSVWSNLGLDGRE